jgi:farnesyl diphosphate synthase
MTPQQYQAWSTQQLALVERALEAWVPADAPAGLGDAMRYGVLDGGKRLRALRAMPVVMPCCALPLRWS